MKKYPHKCSTKFCRGRVLQTTHDKICNKCKGRAWAVKNPIKYAFKNLRNRAKQRGHEFTLTFEEYQHFAVTTGYAELKGKHSYSLSINRKDHRRGYSIDNIETVTLSQNSRMRYSNMPEFLREEMEEAMNQSIH